MIAVNLHQPLMLGVIVGGWQQEQLEKEAELAKGIPGMTQSHAMNQLFAGTQDLNLLF